MKIQLMADFGAAGRLFLIGLCAAGLFSGCAPGEPPLPVAGPPGSVGLPGEPLYKVAVEATPFFRYGPQQPTGPDLSLKRDTRLALIKRSFGYSQVRTPENQTGYVATDEIVPISPEELAAEQQQRMALMAPPGAKKKPGAMSSYTIPPEAGREDRLPEPEVRPTPNPAMFRY
jgi:hypothetical protein